MCIYIVKAFLCTVDVRVAGKRVAIDNFGYHSKINVKDWSKIDRKIETT